MKSKLIKRTIPVLMTSLLCVELAFANVTNATESVSVNEAVSLNEVSHEAYVEIESDKDTTEESKIAAEVLDYEGTKIDMEGVSAPSSSTTITSNKFYSTGTTTWYDYTAQSGINGVEFDAIGSGSFRVYKASDMSEIFNEGVSYLNNTKLYCNFVTGQKYYIQVSGTSSSATTFRLISGVAPTALSFTSPTTSLELGQKVKLTTTYIPSNTDYNGVKVSNNNSSVLYTNFYSNLYGFEHVRAKGLGTGTLTETIMGAPNITQSLSFNVTLPKTIKEIQREAPQQVSITENGKMQFYRFTAPITDTYHLTTSNIQTGNSYSQSKTLYIYDENWKCIDTYDGYTNVDRYKKVEAGETIYVGIGYNNVDTVGSFNFGITGETVYIIAPSGGGVVSPEVDYGIPVEKISLDFTKLKIAKGCRFTIHADVAPANYTDSLEWTSSNPKYVSITKGGVIRAKEAGKSAIISVTAPNGVSASCVVTVPKTRIKATKITVKKDTIKLKVGKKYTIKSTMTPKNTTDNKTYSSKKTNIAEVSSTGVITAKSKGTTTVRVKTTSGKTATVKVIVK